LRERDAAALDAYEAEVGTSVVLFDDLVGEANQGALDLRGRHEAAFFAELRRAGGGGLCHDWG
jgi:hypothetical protein